ncbi:MULTISPECIES: hypothetical protein [unclassified Streptomyces]|uniref:hypothetical protein n=1 Tax=unclassified Streptomyces TaxID=2593676 RepID=UPI00380268E5
MVNTRTRNRGRARTALLGAPVAALLVLALAGCQDPASDAGDKASAPAGSATAGGEAAPGTAQPDGQSSAPASSSATSSAGSAADDPCALVNQTEADQLAGMSLDPGRAIGDTCTYTAPPSGPTGQVEVFVGESGKNYYDAEHQIHGDRLKPLKDVGDEAYLEDGSVFLRVGEQWVSIRLVRTEDSQHEDQPLTELARTVATRL